MHTAVRICYIYIRKGDKSLIDTRALKKDGVKIAKIVETDMVPGVILEGKNGKISLDNSFGLSAQVGMDYQIDTKWHVNASVRFIDIDTEATFKVGDAAGKVSDIEIDPWVYTLSVGYTF